MSEQEFRNNFIITEGIREDEWREINIGIDAFPSPEELHTLVEELKASGTISEVQDFLKKTFPKLGDNDMYITSVQASQYSQIFQDYNLPHEAKEVLEYAGGPTLNSSAPIQKLRNLEQFLPGKSEELYVFASLLTHFIPNPISPHGLRYKIECLLGDLRTGTNSYTEQPFRHKLVGIDKATRMKIRNEMGEVVQVAFPKDFAEEALRAFGLHW